MSYILTIKSYKIPPNLIISSNGDRAQTSRLRREQPDPGPDPASAADVRLRQEPTGAGGDAPADPKPGGEAEEHHRAIGQRPGRVDLPDRIPYGQIRLRQPIEAVYSEDAHRLQIQAEREGAEAASWR